jgi:diguanylate cyclase (GGDEF)-like protein
VPYGAIIFTLSEDALGRSSFADTLLVNRAHPSSGWLRLTTTVVVPSILTGAAFVALSHFGLVGRLPVGGLLCLLAIAAVIGEKLVSGVRPGTTAARLHFAIAAQTLAVTAIIYAIGWGPTLAIGYLFVFARLLEEGGSRVWRPTLLWMVAGIAGGQLAITLDLVPTYVPKEYALGLAALGALGTAFVIRLLGTKTEESEQRLAERNAAEDEVRETLSLLSATLEATADGILVVDRTGQMREYNSRFAEMWQLPSGILDRRDDAAAIEFVLQQLKRPELFVAKIEELYAQPDAISDDIVLFNDGRVFERHSRPQYVDGEIVGRVWSFRDVTERQQLLDDLQHQAFHDALTELANRALLRDRLEHAIARSRRSGAVISVLFCDLDRFKLINDTLGHESGDQLLIEVARRLATVIREGDTVARLGGDEFAIVVDGASPADTNAVAERCLETIREPFEINGRDVFVRASIGVADNHRDALDAEEILCRGDIAMYAAKSRGRDRFERFEPIMQAELTLRHELHGDLRHAIAQDELALHYQPLLNLQTRTVESVEALLRWHHPTRGLVPPVEFIPIAEETGLIIEIGRFVLRTACMQTKQWQQAFAHARNLRVSVNVSAIQLHEEDFADVVEAALQESALHPTNLILELTESTLVSSSGSIDNALNRLRRLGVHIAIDDFGTGYSSLAYLREFPVDYLKIDRSFISRLTSDDDDENNVMVQSIINIGKNLNLGVVAEGIEETAQLDTLQAAGCDSGQGYLFARPIPPDEIPALLADAAYDRNGANPSL